VLSLVVILMIMKILNSKIPTYIISGIAAAVAFVVLAQWAQQHTELIQSFTTQAGWLGVLSYIGVMALSIVFAPLGTGFLLPVAANSYGPFLAAVYSIIGWTLGSVVAFWIAKTFRKKIIKHKDFRKKIQKYEKSIPKYQFYGLVILLRIALPVDLVSYALGFASSMSYRAFFLTTLIGVTPMTFVFTYASTSSLLVQVLASLFAATVFGLGWFFSYRGYLGRDRLPD
jgi:uncharacterized membrane protein YdjX (TVP38/TMEM64 family)